MRYSELIENPYSTGPRWIWRHWNDWVGMTEPEHIWYSTTQTDAEPNIIRCPKCGTMIVGEEV